VGRTADDLEPRMKLADLNPTFREALALHMIFGRLGFAPADIYVHVQNAKMFVIVKRDGKQFNAEVGEYDHGLGVFIPAWKKTTAWFNTTSQELRTEIMDSSKARLDVVGLVGALLVHGFSSLRKYDA
jgi:hypothetical protein